MCIQHNLKRVGWKLNSTGRWRLIVMLDGLSPLINRIIKEHRISFLIAQKERRRLTHHRKQALEGSINLLSIVRPDSDGRCLGQWPEIAGLLDLVLCCPRYSPVPQIKTTHTWEFYNTWSHISPSPSIINQWIQQGTVNRAPKINPSV